MANKLSQGVGMRIKSLVPEGISQLDFAGSIGLKGATFKTWIAETSEPKVEALAIIADKTGCDLNWLISGKGRSGTGEGTDFVHVKRLQVKVSAGAGAANNGEQELEPIAFRRDWLKKHVGVAAENLSVIEARGDSMEPTIRDGSLVLVNHSIERIENDGIYALNIDDDLYIKRVQKNPGKGLTIMSDNPAYPDQVIEKPETINLRIIGLIKWAANAY